LRNGARDSLPHNAPTKVLSQRRGGAEKKRCRPFLEIAAFREEGLTQDSEFPKVLSVISVAP
jgi:hypothetical protein